MSKYKILSLDGGGIRGLATAMILREIEKNLPNPENRDLAKENILRDHFDLIAGTSTGSILAAAIALGRPIGDVVALYKERGERIFRPKAEKITDRIFRTFTQGLSAPLHWDKGLGEELRRELSNKNGTPISLGRVSHNLLIQAYDATNQEPVVFKSHTTDASEKKLPLWEVVKSSCSAPGYFPGHSLVRNGKKAAMVDGGVFANNPTLCGIVEALVLANGISPGDIFCVSVGTGENQGKSVSPSDARKMGFAEWAFPLVGVFMGGASAHVHNLAKRLLPEAGYCRFEFKTKEDLSMDDASPTHLKRLVKITEDYLGNAGNQRLRKEEEESGYSFKGNMEKFRRSFHSQRV